MQWDLVIGLEVHAQLTTQSKLFSGASTGFGAAANEHCSYIDAGLPGTLPVMNKAALLKALRFGIAVNAHINRYSWFERKNYFYPDLPKGYQISQYQSPIIQNGTLSISLPDGHKKNILIERAHLEEDAGKSVHDAYLGYTGIDLNRAGTPLLEIVTSPCLYSAEEAISYLKTLHQLVRFLGICDGNMQEGSFRCDVNLSLKPAGTEKLGIRTELKNLNSFRFIEKAIQFEHKRHQTILERGEAIIQETRLYDPDNDCTRPMRSKESEKDYRYFPDPDLLPLRVDEVLLNEIQHSMPPLPNEIRQTLSGDEQLQEEDINFLLSSPEHYQFYRSVAQKVSDGNRIILNWLRGPYSALLNDTQTTFANPPISAEEFALLLNALISKTISNNTARKIFSAYTSSDKSMSELIHAESKNAIHDTSELEKMIEDCLTQHPQQVEQYKSGKTKLMGFFVGQIMKQSKGKADPAVLSELLREKLS